MKSSYCYSFHQIDEVKTNYDYCNFDMHFAALLKLFDGTHNSTEMFVFHVSFFFSVLVFVFYVLFNCFKHLKNDVC